MPSTDCSSKTRQLPGDVPYSAKTTLMLDFTDTWEDLSYEYFNSVYDVTDVTLRELSRAVFPGGRHNALASQVS